MTHSLGTTFTIRLFCQGSHYMDILLRRKITSWTLILERGRCVGGEHPDIQNQLKCKDPSSESR